MGLMLSNGYGCERDLGKAVDALRRAAALGDARAKTALADCYLHGTNVPQDSKKAVELLLEAVEGGDARGMDLLATCYDQGNGTARNAEEAFRLYTRAAELGFNHSLGNLAVLYITGKGSKKADPLKAVELLQKGTRANDDFCLLLYAKCLETGTGVKANPTLARDFYTKAAEAGNGEAQKWIIERGLDYKRPSGPAFNP
jgi:TPR repeat protein